MYFKLNIILFEDYVIKMEYFTFSVKKTESVVKFYSLSFFNTTRMFTIQYEGNIPSQTRNKFTSLLIFCC